MPTFSCTIHDLGDCRDGDFICDNGDCVDPRDKCDRYPHCLDGSDERSCPYWPALGNVTPNSRFFTCTVSYVNKPRYSTNYPGRYLGYVR